MIEIVLLVYFLMVLDAIDNTRNRKKDKEKAANKYCLSGRVRKL